MSVTACAPFYASRVGDGPIIVPDMDARMGGNISGPSLIRVPPWIRRPLGRYYLYFADHDGRYIRLAYADDLRGPWRTHEPGVLPLQASGFAGHIASPDVHVDRQRQRITMYFHGSVNPSDDVTPQFSRVAVSKDGLDFDALPDDLGAPYFRVFRWQGWHYALAMPGLMYRSRDGLRGFEAGPRLFDARMRHSAVLLDGDRLSVFHTRAGDAPERIVVSEVGLSGDWLAWREGPSSLVLRPERAWEGACLPVQPSTRGLSQRATQQLRDPAIFVEDGRVWLLYCVAGEAGIAMAGLRAAR